MLRFLDQTPRSVKTLVVDLESVWVAHQMRQTGRNQAMCTEQFRKMAHRPSHWKYLQNFEWVTGMEAVCRHTLRSHVLLHELQSAAGSGVVNNRRARLLDFDVNGADGQGTVHLRWVDLMMQPDNQELDWEEYDVHLLLYHFAFLFVPGFATTIHMAQGETIREKFAIAEVDQVKKDPKMLYVALTRGTHSRNVHVLPLTLYSDPWGHTESSLHTSVDGLLWLRAYQCAAPIPTLSTRQGVTARASRSAPPIASAPTSNATGRASRSLGHWISWARSSLTSSQSIFWTVSSSPTCRRG